MQDKTYKLVCELCGGTNIEQRAWVDPNTDIVLDSCSDGEIDDNWCNDCNEPVKFKTIEL
jgi:hypothetical protein